MIVIVWFNLWCDDSYVDYSDDDDDDDGSDDDGDDDDYNDDDGSDDVDDNNNIYAIKSSVSLLCYLDLWYSYLAYDEEKFKEIQNKIEALQRGGKSKRR